MRVSRQVDGCHNVTYHDTLVSGWRRQGCSPLASIYTTFSSMNVLTTIGGVQDRLKRLNHHWTGIGSRLTVLRKINMAGELQTSVAIIVAKAAE